MSELNDLQRRLNEYEARIERAWPLVAALLEPGACQEGVPPAFRMDGVVKLSQAISLRRLADALAAAHKAAEEGR